MNLAPLLEAPLAIQIHVAAVVPAAILGPYMFWARKGTPVHRLLGRLWLGLMVVAAVSSFFIHTINLFMGLSPIHFLSAYVLYGSWRAIDAARRHRIREHRLNVIGMYVGGIMVAGGFTLLPGRLMHDVLLTWPTGWPDTARLASFLAMMAGMVLLLAILSALGASARRRLDDRTT
ncbi:MAG: DUF2306 domain-containing protein [Rhizobium sp.]|nr:DUF2306 domain-containing protein [Rhizobium sp.]